MSFPGKSLPPRRSRELRSQAGAIGFSGILVILFVGAMLFAAMKLLPPYIDNYRLQDSIENISRNSTYNGRMTAEEIRDQVMAEIRELGIPADEKQVAVEKTGNAVNISVQYTVPVDLMVHQMDLNFEPAAGNRNIIARP
jgi:hypothetical protein